MTLLEDACADRSIERQEAYLLLYRDYLFRGLTAEAFEQQIGGPQPGAE